MILMNQDTPYQHELPLHFMVLAGSKIWLMA